MTEHRSRVERSGETVAALVRVLLDVPWSRARKLCTDGRVWIDDVPARDPAARVRAGASLLVRPDAPRDEHDDRELALPTSRILHLDGEVVVVDKPAGISSVPFAEDEHDTLVQRLAVALRRIERRNGPPPRVVHRLDKDTSGVLVFARTRGAERALAQQFRVHSVHRRYLALAHGTLFDRTIRSVLHNDRGDGLRGTWRGRGRAPDGREAITHIRLLSVHETPATTRATVNVSWIVCRLETGRTHQIRIHLAESGHPVVGESVYVREHDNPGLLWPHASDGARLIPRQLLHAAELGFTHPGSEQEVRFASELPDDIEAWRRQLGTTSLEIPPLDPEEAADHPVAPRQAASTRRDDPSAPPRRGPTRAPRSSGRNNDR